MNAFPKNEMHKQANKTAQKKKPNPSIVFRYLPIAAARNTQVDDGSRRFNIGYELFVYKKIEMHITTNLSAKNIEEFYCNRIRNRLQARSIKQSYSVSFP